MPVVLRLTILFNLPTPLWIDHVHTFLQLRKTKLRGHSHCTVLGVGHVVINMRVIIIK